jgi:S1-C subfamily serine protease
VVRGEVKIDPINPRDNLECLLASSEFRYGTIDVTAPTNAISRVEAYVLAMDTTRDLALLQLPAGIAGPSQPALTWGDSNALKVGDRVVAIGYPVAGLTVTSGIVSATRQTDWAVDLIQTDAALNPGNSGGPLLNEKGELVGVVDFRVEGGNYGLNFAVASSTARKWVASELGR